MNNRVCRSSRHNEERSLATGAASTFFSHSCTLLPRRWPKNALHYDALSISRIAMPTSRPARPGRRKSWRPSSQSQADWARFTRREFITTASVHGQEVLSKFPS